MIRKWSRKQLKKKDTGLKGAAAVPVAAAAPSPVPARAPVAATAPAAATAAGCSYSRVPSEPGTILGQAYGGEQSPDCDSDCLSEHFCTEMH